MFKKKRDDMKFLKDISFRRIIMRGQVEPLTSEEDPHGSSIH